jgi:hypothetical protein
MNGDYDSSEERKAREDGKGAHLHLQLYLTEQSHKNFIDDMKFNKLKNAKGKDYGIRYKNVGIVNPFDYSEPYEKDTKR